MKVAIYDKYTGLVDRVIEVPPDMVDIQCRDGEEFFLNCSSNDAYKVENNQLTYKAKEWIFK